MFRRLVIRKADVHDARAISRLEAACFREPWTEEDIRRDIEFNEIMQVIVAEDDEELLGYIDFQTLDLECDLRRICVRPNRRQLNVGTCLMLAMIRFADQRGIPEIRLEVREDNLAAIGLYKNMGFYENGRRKGYYGPDEDAILMLRIGDPESGESELKS